jgi:ATP-dependent DNA helicase RecQ
LKRGYQQVCDALRVGVGQLPVRSFELELELLQHQTGIPGPLLLRCLQWLADSGCWNLRTLLRTAPRVRFTCSEAALDGLAARSPRTYALLAGVLRVAGGQVFTDAVDLDLDKLADQTNASPLVCREQLALLSRQGWLEWYPAGSILQLQFLQPRVAEPGARLLRLDFLAAQREAADNRLEAVLAYARTQQCRAQALQQYFGETEAGHCGKCDLCRARKKKPAQPAATASKVLAWLSTQPSPPPYAHALAWLGAALQSPEAAERELRTLLAEGRLRLDARGCLKPGFRRSDHL